MGAIQTFAQYLSRAQQTPNATEDNQIQHIEAETESSDSCTTVNESGSESGQQSGTARSTESPETKHDTKTTATGSRTPVQEITPPQPTQETHTSCSICWERPVTTAFAPCGHKAGCWECVYYFRGKPCPICRKSIDLVLRTYDV